MDSSADLAAFLNLQTYHATRLPNILPPDARIHSRPVGLQLFGQVIVVNAAGKPLLADSPYGRAFLALLAMRRPECGYPDDLCAMLWPDHSTQDALDNLQQAISDIDAAFGSQVAAVWDLASSGMPRVAQGTILSDLDLITTAAVGPRLAIKLLRRPLLADLRSLSPGLRKLATQCNEEVVRQAVACAEADFTAHDKPYDRLELARSILAIDKTNSVAWKEQFTAHGHFADAASLASAYEQCRTAFHDLGEGEPPADITACYVQHRQLQRAIPASYAGLNSRPKMSSRVIVPRLNLIGAPDDQGIGTALADEIVGALQNFRNLETVASATFRLSEEALSGYLEGTELDYVVEGTIRLHAGGARITLRLIDVNDGNHVIWAHKISLASAVLFKKQALVAHQAAAQIEASIHSHQIARSRYSSSEGLDAFEVATQALAAVLQLDERQYARAGWLLRRAVDINPNLAFAQAWLAYWYIFLIGQNWASCPASAIQSALTHAQRATELDPHDAFAWSIHAHVRAYLLSDIEGGLLLHEQALSLNSAMPLVQALSGLALSYMGEHAKGRRNIQKAQELSNSNSSHEAFFQASLLVPTLLRREVKKAVPLAKRSLMLRPGFTMPYRLYLSALGHSARTHDPGPARAAMQRLDPTCTVQTCVARVSGLSEADKMFYAEGLILAGLPEV